MTQTLTSHPTHLSDLSDLITTIISSIVQIDSGCLVTTPSQSISTMAAAHMVLGDGLTDQEVRLNSEYSNWLAPGSFQGQLESSTGLWLFWKAEAFARLGKPIEAYKAIW
ncbi:hypothetical protein PPACK8108_LOCUS26127 [Phakopsora pachyrhizi]|uniref:Uncharacterized protein n=1 Tax=Phakopsora pachyrhizi TaxID=170000 RepID=A0AAV0BWQ0_PHAPC|nr:hypothetical protein PPACK8108_LOCUS26127 [Phakopsora pachyrhizi]